MVKDFRYVDVVTIFPKILIHASTSIYWVFRNNKITYKSNSEYYNTKHYVCLCNIDIIFLYIKKYLTFLQTSD
jgi:hypothetical protein